MTGLLSILFWLGKDCAWNGLIPSMWFIFVLPTLMIASDFAFSSLFEKVLRIIFPITLSCCPLSFLFDFIRKFFCFDLWRKSFWNFLMKSPLFVKLNICLHYFISNVLLDCFRQGLLLISFYVESG